MQNKPLLSVVTSVYNGGSDLLKFLDSISNQTYENIELVIVDDCSTDKFTKQILNDLIAKKLTFKKRFRFIQNKKNIGVVKAFQKALSNASGEYFTFPESDDYLDYDFYEKCMNTLLAKKANVVKGLLLSEYTHGSNLSTIDNDIKSNTAINDKKMIALYNKVTLPIAIKNSQDFIVSYIMPDITYCWFYVFDKKILLDKNKLSFKKAIEYGFSNTSFYNKFVESKVSLKEGSFYHYNSHPSFEKSGIWYSLDKEDSNIGSEFHMKSEKKLIKSFIKDYSKVEASGHTEVKSEKKLIQKFIKDY